MRFLKGQSLLTTSSWRQNWIHLLRCVSRSKWRWQGPRQPTWDPRLTCAHLSFRWHRLKTQISCYLHQLTSLTKLHNYPQVLHPFFPESFHHSVTLMFQRIPTSTFRLNWTRSVVSSSPWTWRDADLCLKSHAWQCPNLQCRSLMMAYRLWGLREKLSPGRPEKKVESFSTTRTRCRTTSTRNT